MCVSIALTYWNSRGEGASDLRGYGEACPPASFREESPPCRGMARRGVGRGKCWEPHAVDRKGQKDFFACGIGGGGAKVWTPIGHDRVCPFTHGFRKIQGGNLWAGMAACTGIHEIVSSLAGAWRGGYPARKEGFL